jgi:iron-sulfur cluster repair protein YtfE (RIC family)
MVILISSIDHRSCAMLAEKVIDPTVTVRETMAQYPETKAVFARFGVDTCCGSGVPILAAAHRDGADVDALLAALRSSTSQG